MRVENTNQTMTREQFIKLPEGMTDAQKLAAFDYLLVCLSVTVELKCVVSDLSIVDAVERSCNYGKAAR